MPFYNRKIFSIILVIMVLLSTGCYRTLRAPSSSGKIWSSKKQPRTYKDISECVWSDIRKRDAGKSGPLSLDDLIGIALRNNPSTQKAWNDACEAEAEVKQAASKWYPQITVNAKASRQKNIAKFINTTSSTYHYKVITDDDHSEYTPSATLTYLILDFGGRNAAVTGAKQVLLAKNFTFNQAILDLILALKTAYYELYSSRSAMEAAKLNVEDAHKSYILAKEKCDVGIVSKLDVYQAKSDYDNALYSQEEAAGDLKSKKGNLSQVLGFSANTEFDIAAPVQEIPETIEETALNTLIEKALAGRPDIMAARATLRAKEASVRAANSDIWPTLNVGASAGGTLYDYYRDTNENVTSRYRYAHGYEGYVSVSWAIFDGFYNFNKKRAAKAALESVYAQLEQEEIAASQDVWTKYYAYKTSAQKLIYSESFLESTKASYDFAFLSYKEGLKDILDLLNAQSKLSEARSRLIQSKKDLFVSVAELAHSTGVLYLEKTEEGK